MITYLAFENLEEKKVAYSIVSDIFNTIAKGIKINDKYFNLLEETSKILAKSFVDKIIKSHQDWSTEQDEYLEFYEKVKIEINNL